jgi:tetratricopeptide (TPR) repeat protein
MSQEALAQPEFTKSYVSAVERGKARPSLKALELMSRRLGIPMSELLAIAQTSAAETDVAALEEEFTYSLDHARMLLHTGQADEALRLLNGAEQDNGAYLDGFNEQNRYQFHRLRAAAYLRLGEPASARQELAAAMRLAEQLGDPEDTERVRNELGAAFYEQDMPRLGLEQHIQCLEAVRAGTVKDLNLRLSIYGNLANDHWALNDADQAVAVYQEALTLLDDVNNLERQAGIYWDLSQAYKGRDDLDRARLYAAKALDIHEAANNLVAVAQLDINMAEILIARDELDEAERLLERAESLLLPTGNQLLTSVVYEHYADLELRRGQLSEAADYAQQSVQLSEEVFKQQANRGDARAQATTVRTYARALRIAGLIEERQNNTKAADAHFQRALDLAQQGQGDAASEIELSYADVLVGRGAHEQAATHYRAALQHRQQRTPR